MVPTTVRNLGSASPVLKIKIAPATGIHKIRHVVIIMQENRSFDSYFGTYPGADGIPRRSVRPRPGRTAAASPRSTTPPTSTSAARTASATPLADIDGGRMDGFVGQAEQGSGCSSADPNCSPCTEPTVRPSTSAAST